MEKTILLAAVLILLTGTAYAGNFRCPNGSIVSAGDSISDVVVKCDQPTNKIKRTESESTGRGRVRYVEVEEWTYNEGMNTLVHYLIFRDGALVEIRTGTFGR